MKQYNVQYDENGHTTRWNYSVEVFNKLTSEWVEVERDVKYFNEAVRLSNGWTSAKIVPLGGHVRILRHQESEVWDAPVDNT